MIAFVALVLVSTTFAQSNKNAADEAAVRKLYDDERKAFLKADAKELSTYFADEFFVTNPFNQLALKKAFFIDLVANGTLAFSKFERTIEHMQFYNDMVIVAGRETCGWAGKMPLAGKTSELRFTGVARKVNGRWIEVARHANIIVPGPAPVPPKQ
jgi:hypothetical protein